MYLAPFAWRCSRAVARPLAALAVASAVASAQQGTITGHVTAAGSKEPLAQAHVIAIGTSSSTTTGQDGKYTLRHLAPGKVEVQVLRPGFQAVKKSITVEGTAAGSTLDFEMSTAVVKLAEVVSTANGEQRRVELGYSTASLNDVAKRMEESPTILTVGDLLTQRAPSVNVLGQGMVAAASSIRIRGLSSLTLSNEPMFLVDGARVAADAITPGSGVGGTQSSLLNSFAPDEIESIEIMKGPAATAVYGTNAANGVVLISTKKGRVGGSRWTWTAEQGRIKDENEYPSSFAIWGHTPNSGAATRCLLATMGPSTCIQDSVTSLNILKNSALTPLNTGRRNNYGMQVAGGTDIVRYFIGANLENDLGPIQMPDFAYHRLDSMKVKVRGEWRNPEALQRQNLRANFNATVTQNLELGATAGFVKSDQRFPQSDNSPISLFAAARANPGFAHAGLGYSNVGALGEPLNGYNQWVPSEIFQDLNTQNIQRQTMTGNIGWRAQPWMQNDFLTAVDYMNYTDFGVCRLNECPAYSNLRNGTSYSSTTSTRVVTARGTSVSSWNARPDMIVRSTVGTEYMEIATDGSTGIGIGLPPGAQNVGQAATRTASSNIPAVAGKTLGLFVQEQASLRDRLFLNVGVRADRNNAFGANKEWAYYPKAGVSHLLSEEAFFPKLSWLDQLQTRATYGVSGRQPNLTQAFASYRPLVASLGGSDQRGLINDQLGNVDLKPERSAEFELGVDARILKNRVNVELTYFNKNTTNAIVAAPIAASSGAGSLFQPVNAGEVQNSGFESVITAQLIDNARLGWDFTVSASHGTNKVKAMGPSGTLQYGNTWLTAGYPIDALFFRTYSFGDANSDGRIQPAEVTVDTTSRFMGYQVPRDLVAIQNGFDLFSRRVRINAMFDYKGGHSVFDASSAYLCAQFTSCADESDPSATLAQQARAVANQYGTTVGGRQFTTPVGYLSNGAFWRFRELSVNYTLPVKITRTLLRAERASLTFGARNLHVWTNYSGVDPESNFGAGDLQTDFMTAGPPRYYNLRLNIHY